MPRKRNSRKKEADKTQGSDASEPGNNQGSILSDKRKTDDMWPSSPGSPGGSWRVVGIGASAGGLTSLEHLFSAISSKPKMAFVVVSHLGPNQPSLLAEILQRLTDMPVIEVYESQVIEPNCIYVIAPGQLLSIKSGVLNPISIVNAPGLNQSIDYFFSSLAADQKKNAIGVVLSGSGSDGSAGIKAIQQNHGMTMVESPDSAVYGEMPKNAIATGAVDLVLPPEQIADLLDKLGREVESRDHSGAINDIGIPEDRLKEIISVIVNHTGHDFAGYKPSTVRRRIFRRMTVHHTHSAKQYCELLAKSPQEIDILFRDLLISVTTFFRDGEAWERLSEFLGQMLQSKRDSSPVRAWIPGCATGEEVYSLAIVLSENMKRLNRHFPVQIFGTDLDSNAIAKARLGQFDKSISLHISRQRLDNYFVEHHDRLIVRKEIREMAVFAEQNLIQDPPFTRLDIISCRNLLIYLSADLQRSVIPAFHYGLSPGGILFLGPSETIGAMSDSFQPLDKRWKIYQKTAIASTHQPNRDVPTISIDNKTTAKQQMSQSQKEPANVPSRSLAKNVENMLLTKFALPSVVIDQQGEIVYIYGRTGLFLEPPIGQPRANIIELAREGLGIELASAVRQCVSNGVTVIRDNVQVKTNGDFSAIRFSVSKIQEHTSLNGLYLVTFEIRPPKPSDNSIEEADGQQNRRSSRLHELEKELRLIKESHEKTLEELEVSNEELKSMNEELQSTNEEFQSTNEELETSKEEMQSLNEELSTVNTELQSKVEALAQANDDMQNLLNSTEIATLFLDNELNINRFTEQTQKLIKLRNTDVGRPISDISSSLNYGNLVADCREVLSTLNAHEQEVCSDSGIWYLMRIRPYRTAENLIEGLVITFVNIQRLKDAELSAEMGSVFEQIVTTVREPLVIIDNKLEIILATKSFCSMLHVSQKTVSGAKLTEVFRGIEDKQQLTEVLLDAVAHKKSVEKQLVRATTGQGEKVEFYLNASRLKWKRGQAERLFMIAFEVVK
ncbi:PAS domain-containing protein [bacterium]|nr:PAS domain-containing protein [bacterium]